jgi:hypothetical protein
MLFEETSGDSKLKRYAQNVLTAATRGREIVGQILTYSRTQRRARVPVDLATVVAETLELIRGSLPAGIRLEASAPETPLVLIGDATQLHQVAMNLCTNAIQAMSTGGTLRVALESAELPSQALSHGTLEPGRYVRLIVADSGSGMNENILAHIFEPFFTTHGRRRQWRAPSRAIRLCRKIFGQIRAPDDRRRHWSQFASRGTEGICRRGDGRGELLTSPSGGNTVKHVRDLFLAAACALCVLAAVPAAASDASDIAATVKKWVSDFNKGDMKSFLAACAPNVSVVDGFPPYAWPT